MTGLKVLNGRVGADSTIGQFTCLTSKWSSVIDLVMCSPSLFKCVDQFEVFDPNLISDHCVVHFCINTYSNEDTFNDIDTTALLKNKYAYTTCMLVQMG